MWSVFWGEWSSCDTECSRGGEPGSQTRKRECVYEDQSPAPVGTGLCTHGQDVEFRECEPTPPPCSKWASWGFWSRCSTSCGAGRRTRNRSCLYGGKCQGPKTEEENCVDTRRPVCPSWSQWKVGSLCSVTCGMGVASQYRTCLNGQINEVGCTGPAAKHNECQTGRKCPVWGYWTEWSECGVTCGTSKVTRSRSCINGDPGETGCIGKPNDIKVCIADRRRCPSWGSWGQFSMCSATCGDGEHYRSRQCINGSPGDVGCDGSVLTRDLHTCSARRNQCPEWDLWASWSACSVTCGLGNQLRLRECNHGAPSELGCLGSTESARECYGVRRECEYWGDWASWSPCSVTCGSGNASRERPCMNGKMGDAGCQGSNAQTISCDMQDCEEYVEYDGDETLDTELDSICPNILRTAEIEGSVY